MKNQIFKTENNISETKTENLFREFYKTTTFLEKSAIPKKYGFVSKKGTKYNGYPDFFLDRSFDNYVIIVEAKAKNHYAAEEEVKYYMQNDKIDIDEIGIAISGQEKTKIKLSYFYKMAEEREIKVLADEEKFLDLKAINKLYEKIKYGESVTNETLKLILKSLNKKLQENSTIRDTDRTLFFSGLMIALKNSNFRNTYKKIDKANKTNMLESHNLNNAIITAITEEIIDKINNKSKEMNWSDNFAFIKCVDFDLDEYKKIIQIIEEKIFIPFQKEEKQDILGSAYKIFLSRAGKVDNKNIILTPDHIKSLMVKLACINKDDVVLDIKPTRLIQYKNVQYLKNVA